MSEKGKGCGGRILGYIIAIGVFIALVAGGAAISSYVSSHSKQFSKADYEDMNALVASGEDLPTGKLGRLSIRWVLGCFAEEENYQSSYGIKFGSGKSYYYAVILDDMRIIAIQASDETEIQRLEKMTNDYEAAYNVYSLPSQDFEGRIDKLSNKEVKQYYDEALTAAGYKAYGSGFTIQYVTLNTAAIPTQNTLMYVGIGAAVIVALVLFFRSRNKKKQAETPAETQPDPYTNSNNFSS